MLADSAAAGPGDLDLFFDPTGEGGNVPGMAFGASFASENTIFKLGLLPDGRIVGMGDASGGSLIGWLPDGSLDHAFGEDGFVRFESITTASLKEMAVQPDGKVLLVGHSGFNVPNSSSIVLRLQPDGTLDPSFGNDGRVMLSAPGTENYATALALGSDGAILAGGYTRPNGIFTSHRTRVWRLLPDGSQDQTFGAVNGMAFFGGGYISQMAVQPGGKIVATITDTFSEAWLARLNPDGSLDTGFRGGRFKLPFPVNTWKSDSVKLALYSGGKILVAGDFAAGTERPTSDHAFFVARFNQDGSTDPGFGDGGRTTLNLSSSEDLLEALCVQADGKVLVAGRMAGNLTPRQAVLVRYYSDGTLDAEFGTGGVAAFRTPTGNCGAESMVVQPDGKILIGGDRSALLDFQSILMRVSTLPLPESLSAEWPAGTPLPSGGTVKLGIARGDPEDPETTVTLRNTGAAPLTNLSAAIAGREAARFVLLSTPPSILNSGETMTLKVRFLPVSNVSGFDARLIIETGNPEIADFMIVLRGETQTPVSALALFSDIGMPGTWSPIAPDTTVSFDYLPGTPSITRHFTMRNTGNIDLLIQDISLGSAGTPEDFAVGALESDVLAAGASTTFSVTFTPGGPGTRTARLRIVSTDTFSPPVEIILSGMPVEGIEAWWLTHFGTVRRDGVTADAGDPDHDGVVNLMEYATLTDPFVPGPASGQLTMTGTGPGRTLHYTFLRPAAAEDQLRYSLEWSASPQGPWSTLDTPLEVLSSDSTRQQVRYSVFVANSWRFLVRLRVERK